MKSNKTIKFNSILQSKLTSLSKEILSVVGEEKIESEEFLIDSISGKKTDVFFLSDNCECQFTESYGFVPESDCEDHDTRIFSVFVDLIKNRAAQEKSKAVQEIFKKYGV